MTLEGLPPEPRPLLQPPLYAHQRGESRQAYAAFCAYRDLGPQRSIEEAYRTAGGAARAARGSQGTEGPSRTRASGRWRTWAAHWQWTERAQAWDDHLDAEARSVTEQAARDAALELAGQRRAQRQREYDLGIALLARAQEMLQLPLVEVTREADDGRNVTVIKPVAWRQSDLGTIARVGVELARLGLEMESAKSGAPVDIEAEIRELARQHGWDEDLAVQTALRYAHERGERAG